MTFQVLDDSAHVAPIPAVVHRPGCRRLNGQRALIEARRMADDVVGPWEVDPQFALPAPSRAIVSGDANGLSPVEPTSQPSQLAVFSTVVNIRRRVGLWARGSSDG